MKTIFYAIFSIVIVLSPPNAGAEDMPKPVRSAQAYYAQGLAELESGKIQKSVGTLTQAIELKPDEDAYWFTRAVALDALGQKENALKDYSQAATLRPNNPLYTRFVEELKPETGLDTLEVSVKEKWKNEQFTAAVQELQLAVRTDPTNKQIHAWLGQALLRVGRKEEALREFDRAGISKDEQPDFEDEPGSTRKQRKSPLLLE